MLKKILVMLCIFNSTTVFSADAEQKLRFQSGYSYNCTKKVGNSSIDSTVTVSPTSNLYDFEKNKKANNCSTTYNYQASFAEVSLSAISSFIKPLRKELCDIAKPGSVKISLGVDAEGKIYGVGIGANGSIEMNFECK